jgi:hypothetical protein
MVMDFANGRVASPVQIFLAVIRVRGIASIVDMRNQLSIVCNGLLAGLFFGALVSCADDAPKPKLPAAFPVQTATDPLTSSATSNPSLIELPSITLPKPAAWTWVKPSMQFRTLQYQVCNSGSGKVAPCADLIVSVFKLGDGGSVDANIGRWKNQFQNTDGSPAQPTRSQRVVAGASVTRVDLKGAWKGMGMGEAQNNSEQLAAAIELPQETIYIRMVGPESTVEAARKEFEAMVDGLAPRAPLVK